MEALGFVCVALVVGLFIGLLVGAVILRAACHLTGVPVPDMGKAMGVVFVTALLLSFANFAVGFMIGAGMGATGRAGNEEQMAVAQLLSMAVTVPLDFVLAAALYTAMLERVTFGKGLLIYLVQFLIGLAILIVIIGVLFIAGMGGALLRR